MNLKIQIIVILVSFLFGFVYCTLFKYYKKYIMNSKFKIISDFLYNFIFLLLFVLVFYKINYLFLTYYMTIFFSVGFLVSYLTVNHF